MEENPEWRECVLCIAAAKLPRASKIVYIQKGIRLPVSYVGKLLAKYKFTKKLKDKGMPIVQDDFKNSYTQDRCTPRLGSKGPAHASDFCYGADLSEMRMSSPLHVDITDLIFWRALAN